MKTGLQGLAMSAQALPWKEPVLLQKGENFQQKGIPFQEWERRLEAPHCPQNVGRKEMDTPTMLVIDCDNGQEGTEDVDKGAGVG